LSIITVLVFAGIPVAVFVVIAGLVYAGSARRGKRYRPGRPYRFTPVWFLSAPESMAPDAGSGRRHALDHGPQRGELAAATATDERSPAERAAAERSAQAQDVTGGASDRW
jgi:hypothetical protein